MPTPKKPRKPRAPATPSTNGQPPPAPPVKAPAPKRVPLVGEIALVGLPPVEEVGRCAAAARSRSLDWLWRPWVPAATLSFVVGQTNTGKSSFIAWLMAQHERTMILPGYEEAFDLMALARLKRHGADLGGVRVLDGRQFAFRAHLDLLCRVATDWKASLIVFDPADSYLDDSVNENDGPAVRHSLEAAATLAERTGAAVVCVRHPGKATDNVCPGSRQWRNVPRVIIELVEEPTRPAKRFMRAYKYGIGPIPKPRAFTMEFDSHLPPLFVLGEEVAAAVAELARDVPDRMERGKIETACELLQHLLKEGEMEAKEVFCWAERERLSEGTLRRAADRLGVLTRRDGFGLDCKGYWRLPTAATSPR